MSDFKRIAIIGVGLIGGSFGLAVKERELADDVVGIGYRDETLVRAEARGAIDRWTLDLEEGVSDADLAVVCTPVGLVPEKAIAAAQAMPPGGIVTDVASTKEVITGKIEAELPDGIAFVPAHPMAGSEERGNENATAGLFEGARVILTLTDRTPDAAADAVHYLWERLGARVERLDVAAHDRIVARISHLPHLIAPALVNAVDEASLPYAATGMKDTTRIAASDVRLWVDIFRDNRLNVLDALRAFGVELESIGEALERSDWAKLARCLERARDRRQGLSDDE